MNSKRTQKYFIEVLKKPTSATMIALIICLVGSHLTITVNAQFSRNDYRSGFLVTNPCVSKQTCSECLQTPTCAWCMKEVRGKKSTLNFILMNSKIDKNSGLYVV